MHNRRSRRSDGITVCGLCGQTLDGPPVEFAARDLRGGGRARNGVAQAAAGGAPARSRAGWSGEGEPPRWLAPGSAPPSPQRAHRHRNR
jgi:hypothetical protein